MKSLTFTEKLSQVMSTLSSLVNEFLQEGHTGPISREDLRTWSILLSGYISGVVDATGLRRGVVNCYPDGDGIKCEIPLMDDDSEYWLEMEIELVNPSTLRVRRIYLKSES